MKHKTFFRNVAVVSLGGFFARGIGALYRIPLVGVLGGYGMGLYQMAYPFFCLMLTFSSAGVPAALARMVAREEGGGDRRTVAAAAKLFFLLGLFGSALMAVLAPLVGRLQGNADLPACYLALAPSVVLVSLIAVLRGYFQGKSDLAPTAFSEIAEQLVKAAAGTLLAYRFAGSPRAVAAALFAVTLSECAALLYLYLRWKREKKSRMLPLRPTTGSDVFRAALPVMASAAILPLSQTVDSVLVVRLLALRTARAVALYGLLSGAAAALVRLPASLCCGIAAAIVPSVSRAAERGGEEARERSLKVLGLTLALSAPCAAGLFLFARPIVSLLYGGLSAEDAAVLVRLVRILSLSAVSVSATEVLAACLTGMGRANCAAGAMLAAVTVKLLLQLVLVPDPALTVEGAAIASNVCYSVAFFLDLIYTVRKKRGKAYDHGRESRNGAGRSDPAGERGAFLRGRGARAHRGNSLGADA